MADLGAVAIVSGQAAGVTSLTSNGLILQDEVARRVNVLVPYVLLTESGQALGESIPLQAVTSPSEVEGVINTPVTIVGVVNVVDGIEGVVG